MALAEQERSTYQAELTQEQREYIKGLRSEEATEYEFTTPHAVGLRQQRYTELRRRAANSSRLIEGFLEKGNTFMATNERRFVAGYAGEMGVLRAVAGMYSQELVEEDLTMPTQERQAQLAVGGTEFELVSTSVNEQGQTVREYVMHGSRPGDFK